jgi:hypothetical protein
MSSKTQSEGIFSVIQRQRSSAAFWRKIVHMKQLVLPWHGIENDRILSDIYYQHNPKKGKGETVRNRGCFHATGARQTGYLW